MSFRRLQREWYGKLKASGFVDLEANVWDGALSDRGNLHPVEETEQGHQRLAQRIDDGSEYTAWAESVLHHGPRLPPQEGEVWRLHAQGMSEVDIGTALTITRRTVRGHLARTRRRVSKVSRTKRWLDRKRQRRAQFRQLVRNVDPTVLVRLVAVMLRQQARSSR